MDNRIATLVADLSGQVDPQIGNYVVGLAAEGLTFDEIMAKLRSIMATAEALRQADRT